MVPFCLENGPFGLEMFHLGLKIQGGPFGPGKNGPFGPGKSQKRSLEYLSCWLPKDGWDMGSLRFTPGAWGSEWALIMGFTWGYKFLSAALPELILRTI